MSKIQNTMEIGLREGNSRCDKEKQQTYENRFKILHERSEKGTTDNEWEEKEEEFPAIYTYQDGMYR